MAKLRRFTPEEDQYIIDNYLKKPLKRISRELNRSESSARQRLHLLGYKVPKEIAQIFSKMSQFKKGHSSFNKGKKQSDYMSKDSIKKVSSTQFKKGHLPHNTKGGPGTITVRNESKGMLSYKYICIEYGKWELLHIHLWEKEHGKMPEGHCLWFKDGDTHNCDLNNLELITRAENLRRNNLTDSAIASKLAKLKGVKGKVDYELRDRLIKHPELIDLKRKQLKLNRTIKERRNDKF